MPLIARNRALQSDLTEAQNERLRCAMLSYRDKYCASNTKELASRLGRAQPSISNILNRKSGSSYATAASFAALVKKSVSEVLGSPELGPGENLKLHRNHHTSAPDYIFAALLLKMSRMKGFQQWIDDNPSELKMSEVASCVAAYEELRPPLGADGMPSGGWVAFINDVLNGRLTGPRKLGDQAKAEAIERRRIPRGVQKRQKKL